jgi:hypothetical protein
MPLLPFKRIRAIKVILKIRNSLLKVKKNKDENKIEFREVLE